MVFILKEESEKSPGIAVFSHKEFKKFSNYKVFNLILEKLSRYFYFGVHWGDSFKNIEQFNFDNIDINFCYPEQLPELKKKRNFKYSPYNKIIYSFKYFLPKK